MNAATLTWVVGAWIAAAVFMVGASLITRAPDPQRVGPYVWRPGMARETEAGEVPQAWYQHTGVWAVVAAIMFATIYIVYW